MTSHERVLNRRLTKNVLISERITLAAGMRINNREKRVKAGEICCKVIAVV